MRIGQEANRLATSPSFGGTILAVFSKNIYLSGRDGDILWMAKEDLPMHRRCIKAPFQPHSLRPGQSFWISRSSLRIGEAMAIDLDRAEEWKPFIVGPGQADPMFRVNERVNWLFSILPSPHPEAGFGQAIPMISAIVKGKDLRTVLPDSLFNRAIGPIHAIANACLREDIVQVAQTGRELIGLGPGLTPSGDDFLGGLFFALHFLKRIFTKEFFWDDQPILDLINWSFSRTNPISHAILSDLSSGNGPEPIYIILNFLLSGGNRDEMLLNIDRLCGIGHTSGWDLLTGLLTGMVLVTGKVKRFREEAGA